MSFENIEDLSDEEDLELMNSREYIIENIEHLERQMESIEERIRELWDNIIVRYKRDMRSQILDGLNENDYNKFFNFMIEYSPAYNVLIKKMKYYKNLLELN